VASWIVERKAEQNVWRKKSNSYKMIIDKMLFSGGDFVFIPKKGEPVIDLLAKSARKFKAVAKKVRNPMGSNPKAFLMKYIAKDSKRYRLCIGYCLIVEHEISFWTKHYWVYDRTAKNILECTVMKPRFYFGVMLTEKGAAQINTKVKGGSV
jgi:hypothetical protein